MVANTFVHPEIWSKEIQTIFDEKTVMRPLVNTKYEGEVSKAGDTVHVQNVGDITINNYTRDTAITIQSITNTDSSLLINQEKSWAFQIDDVDKKQSHIEFVSKYSTRAAVAKRNLIDSFLLSFHADAQTENKIGTTSLPVTLTQDNVYQQITELGKRLDDASIDEEGRKLVVTPFVKQLLLNAKEFTKASALGDKTVTNGKIGTVANFMVYCTTNISQVSNAKYMMAFTEDFISFAHQMTKVEQVRPYDFFAELLKGLEVYGGKVFSNHAAAGAVLYHQPA